MILITMFWLRDSHKILMAVLAYTQFCDTDDNVLAYTQFCDTDDNVLA